MRYARACIECDVTAPIPDKVWVGLPDNKGFWQDIVVEGNLAYCSHCKVHVHELANCINKKPSSNAEAIADVAQGSHQDLKREWVENKNKNNAHEKNDVEWRVVESKKMARRANTNPGYSPDLLYANTKLSSTKRNQIPANAALKTYTQRTSENREGVTDKLEEFDKDQQMEKPIEVAPDEEGNSRLENQTISIQKETTKAL